MDLLLFIGFFILGLIVGSFLNVVILRMNTARSFGGRSACMSCKSKLRWFELVPVFSFLLLGGRCRNCKSRISVQYLLVELSTGLIFSILFWKFYIENGREILSSAFVVPFVYFCVIFSILLVVAVYDLRHKIIPDRLSIILGILGFAGLFFFRFAPSVIFSFNPQVPSIWQFVSGPLIAFPFAFFWLISLGRWMGLGDAKLALGAGWVFGLSLALSGLVLAFWLGAAIGIALVVISKYRNRGTMGMKSELPFAPFLVIGLFLAFIFELPLFF